MKKVFLTVVVAVLSGCAMSPWYPDVSQAYLYQEKKVPKDELVYLAPCEFGLTIFDGTKAQISVKTCAFLSDRFFILSEKEKHVEENLAVHYSDIETLAKGVNKKARQLHIKLGSGGIILTLLTPGKTFIDTELNDQVYDYLILSGVKGEGETSRYPVQIGDGVMIPIFIY